MRARLAAALRSLLGIKVTTREEVLLERLVAKLEQLQHVNYVTVEIEGEHIVEAIKRRKGFPPETA